MVINEVPGQASCVPGDQSLVLHHISSKGRAQRLEATARPAGAALPVNKPARSRLSPSMYLRGMKRSRLPAGLVPRSAARPAGAALPAAAPKDLLLSQEASHRRPAEMWLRTRN